MNKKKVVVIGGGSGIFPVLTGLKDSFDLTAITTTADGGGSTGILREEFGILPPGDIRRALIALSHSDNKILSELFNYRFTEGKGLTGHSFGNLLLTALERITGSFEKAIEEAGKILAIQGKIIPVSLEPTTLVAKLENGKIVRGESNIDIPRHDGRLRIEKVYLDPPADLNPQAKNAILEANAVIIGPGDLYTSLLPNILVDGMKEALQKTEATVIYFVNCMTKYGETTDFAASDFLSEMTAYVGERAIDYVAVNNVVPAPSRLKPYAQEHSWPVTADIENLPAIPIPIATDLIRSKGFIRHDPKKIAQVISLLIS